MALRRDVERFRQKNRATSLDTRVEMIEIFIVSSVWRTLQTTQGNNTFITTIITIIIIIIDYQVIKVDSVSLKQR